MTLLAAGKQLQPIRKAYQMLPRLIKELRVVVPHYRQRPHDVGQLPRLRRQQAWAVRMVGAVGRRIEMVKTVRSKGRRLTAGVVVRVVGVSGGKNVGVVVRVVRV